MNELKIEELTVRQKLGMTFTAHIGKAAHIEPVIELIKERSVGSVWVIPTMEGRDEAIRRIKEAADYPILIMCDAESGIGEYKIGRHNSIGCTGSEELAYLFGKVTAITAKNMGYNVICDPVLDMVRGNCVCGGTVRSLGKNKYEVARLAKAEARGFHDCGVLTVAKHYPGKGNDEEGIDTHMGEAVSYLTAEELLEYNLYPYIELNKEGLIDGVMLRHARFVNIDAEHTASVSRKVIQIFRDQGFDGFALTDGLTMMGVVARYGKEGCVRLSVGNGADIALPYNVIDNMKVLDTLEQAYNEGIITDARLNEAVTRVLAAQHKTLSEPKYTELTEKELADFSRINTDSVYAKTDDGVPLSLDREGRYYFAILTETEIDISNRDAIPVDTMDKDWYRPYEIADRLKSYFPNSTVDTINEYPSRMKIIRILEDSIDHDSVVFITFFNSQAYIGTEHFTTRIISIMNAMQGSDRISAIVHCGNPYLLEDVPHIPRVIIGTCSADGVDAAIDVLAGKNEARGVLTYDINLK